MNSVAAENAAPSALEAPPRILAISSDTYPPTRPDVAVLFGEVLARRGYRVDWILQSEADCQRAHEAPWCGGTALIGPTDLGTSLWNRIRKHLLGIRHDLRVLSRARRCRYDIIEVKDKFVAGVFGLLAARFSGARFVYWLSWPYPEEYLTRARDGTARYPFLYRIRGGAFWFLLYKVILPAADHIFVQSEQMKRDIMAEGINGLRITAVPMGVRSVGPLAFGPRLRPTVRPDDSPCVLYLGTLSKVRRLDFLVRVLARLRERVPSAKLYFVGSGDDPTDEQLLIDEAHRLGLSAHVVLVGKIAQECAFRWVEDADVCVSPFFPTAVLNSTSPTKLVEYMALGKAVVANDHPDQRLVLEESGGGICVAWDEAAFAEAIAHLLESPRLAAEMGERGRTYVANHRTYPKIADAVDRVLRMVAACRTS